MAFWYVGIQYKEAVHACDPVMRFSRLIVNDEQAARIRDALEKSPLGDFVIFTTTGEKWLACSIKDILSISLTKCDAKQDPWIGLDAGERVPSSEADSGSAPAGGQACSRNRQSS
jgi:hypothetical protein